MVWGLQVVQIRTLAHLTATIVNLIDVFFHLQIAIISLTLFLKNVPDYANSAKKVHRKAYQKHESIFIVQKC